MVDSSAAALSMKLMAGIELDPALSLIQMLCCLWMGNRERNKPLGCVYTSLPLSPVPAYI